MSYERALKDVQGIKAKLLQGKQAASLIASLNGFALIKKRVIAEGENSSGGKFEAYSDNELPTFFFTGGSASAKAKLKKIDKPSYKDWRRANNLQVGHKDFRFTGRMWANIKPEIVGENDGVVKVVIDAEAAFEKQKVKWNIERDGNFLNPNKSELEFVKETFNKELAKRLFE